MARKQAPSHKELARDFLRHVNKGDARIVATSGEHLMTYDRGVWRGLTDAEQVKLDDTLSDKIQDQLGGATPNGTFGSVVRYLHRIGDYYKSAVEFDDNADLFGFRNGVLDIRTGEFRQHSPENWITKARTYEYLPDARAPRFEAFLKEVLLTSEDSGPDEELAELVQEMCGYCLCSHLRANRVFYLVGEGANGKSVLLGVLSRMIGQENVAEGFDVRRLNDETNAALLHGKLVAIQTEMEADTILPDGKLKAMASGEPLVAKLLYENKFTFQPHATLILTGNNLPRTRDKSTGFWRRTIVIPFHARFVDAFSNRPGERMADPDLDLRLAEELPGIFNWAYCGLNRLRLNQWRFTVPQSSLAATERFRTETDNVLGWARHCMSRSDRSQPSRYASSELYVYYSEFCKTMGYKPMSGQQFFKRLKQIVLNRELDVDIELSRMATGAGYQGRFKASATPVEVFLEDAADTVAATLLSQRITGGDA